MESLKEKSINVILKYDHWKKMRLPLPIERLLKNSNDRIRVSMSGLGYCDIYSVHSVRFNIQWMDGSWDFTLFGGTDLTVPLMYINIGPQTEMYMDRLWSSVFALNGTRAFMDGFYINGFDLLIDEKRISFHGYFNDCNGEKIEFNAEFGFSLSPRKLYVKTVRSDCPSFSKITFYETDREFCINSVLFSW